MFKLALNAGHGYETAGKRCLKSIDPNETREYVLNRRICDKIEQRLEGYGIDILRIDNGTDIAISKRAKAANDFGADFYLAIHHNAGIGGGAGGGTEAYVYLKVDDITRGWQSALYERAVSYGGLRGNRAEPIKSADFGELRETKMPAVLLECGFMDSTTDTPIILTDAFADNIARAAAEVIIEKSGVKPTEATKTASQIAKEVIDGKWGNGAERRTRLTAAGYNYPEIQSAVNTMLQVPQSKNTVAQIAAEVIQGKWGNGTERRERLSAAGYNYSAVQAEVNKLVRGG